MWYNTHILEIQDVHKRLSLGGYEMSDKLWDIIGRLATIGIAGLLILACVNGLLTAPKEMCLDMRSFPLVFGAAGVALLWGVFFRWKSLKETFGVS